MREKIRQIPLFNKGQALYKRYERFVPVGSFVAGFAWDNLTFTRIDLLTDNLILFVYLLLLSLLIFASQVSQLPKKLEKFRDYIPSGTQFLLGGLFSNYVVFYIHSASFSRTALFLLLLAGLLIANEVLNRSLSNLPFLMSMHFVAAFSFFIFLIPMLLRHMNVFTFLLGALCGAALSAAIPWLLWRRRHINRAAFRKALIPLAIIGALLILFYFRNWIPPVPLALKDAAVYRHVHKAGDDYVVRYTQPRWYEFFRNSEDPFAYASGDTVFSFVSVFAPTHLEKTILQRWQYFDQNKDQWITTDTRGYVLSGGRDGGFRGYTYKKNVQPGNWRIEVVTDDELLLGRLTFAIDNSGKSDRILTTEIK